MKEPRKPKSDVKAFQEACQRAGVDDPLPRDPDLHITPLRGSPDVIDEITHGTLIHIERMDEHGYFFRLGDAVFSIRSAARHGAGVEIVAEMVPGYDDGG